MLIEFEFKQERTDNRIVHQYIHMYRKLGFRKCPVLRRKMKQE